MAAADTVLSIVKVDGGVRVSWSGGFPPYRLWRCNSILGTWYEAGVPTMALSSNQALIGSEGYFKVQQSVMLLDLDLSKPNTTLVWSVPELADSTQSSLPPIPS